MMSISQLKKVSEKDVEQINSLLVQISEKVQPFSVKEMRSILKQEHLVFLVAKNNSDIIGMGSLWLFRKSLGLQGIIEDMVVDARYQGKGIGKKIAKKLIAMARRKRLVYIDLTSRPARVAANELYKKLGFELRETNVYRLYLAG